MNSEWITASLLDYYEVRSGLSKPAKDFGSGYPFLTFKDVFYNYFTPESLGDFVQSTQKEREGCSVLRGDVFLTRTSETMHELGMSCVALRDYKDATFNGFCKRLRPKSDSNLLPEYVGYYLRSPKFRQAMLALSTMSTRASLNNEMIGRLEISFPHHDAQKEIAGILKSLDDRITLLRETSSTLEAMAQALFKSWFVDFDPVRVKMEGRVPECMDEAMAELFPDGLEESELGLVPKGWKITKFGDIVKRLSVGKKFDQKTALADGNVPILDQGRSGIIGYHNEAPGVQASLENPVVVFANHTCYMRLITFSFSAIQNVLPFIGNGVDTVWAFFATKDKVKFSEYKGHWPDFTIENIIVPPSNLTECFRGVVDPLIGQIRLNELRVRNLAEIRNILLPQLISGQLCVAGTETRIDSLAA